jgi:RsiW-degrading membrane proteinase PrsW (M82 family)
MTGPLTGRYQLRASDGRTSYPLMPGNPLTIGRDASCQVVINERIYPGVSRRHAELRPMGRPGEDAWQACDLNSSNGTYVNGQRLSGYHQLKPGDRIRLDSEGPEFIFSIIQQSMLEPPAANPFNHGSGNGLGNSPGSGQSSMINLQQLFPVIGATKGDLFQKAYLIPGALTVLLVVALFASIGVPWAFNFFLAAYIGGMAFYFVYRMCGKVKPWWVMVGAGLITAFLLVTPFSWPFFFIFRRILPGNLPDDLDGVNIIQLFIGMFFGAGLMEELLKMVPVFIFMLWGNRLRSPSRERIGVREPLDGILLGAASAVGFTLIETLGQYVPNLVQEATSRVGEGSGELLGLQLLIPRVLGSVAGHMAYSGYMGYFVGLSALKPKKRWHILGIGWLTSSLLHALWNSVGGFGKIVQALIGVASYVFLMAAILQARKLSPNRADNFATRIIQRPR